MVAITQSIVPTIADTKDFDAMISSYLQKGDKLALFLDYDGTLAPMASHPSNTVMEPESEASLLRLAAHPSVFLAVISGRGPQDVKDKVGLPNITYAGNHGLQIIYPDNTRFNYHIAQNVKDNFILMVSALEEQLSGNGAWVENKNASLSFHYREVPGELHAELNRKATEIITSFGYIANQAHCAVEAKPPVLWNKGEAALHILREQYGENWCTVSKAIFAGDDTTDEDAMKALKGKGMSFRVSADENIKTFADYRLPSTKTISMLLNWIEKNL